MSVEYEHECEESNADEFLDWVKNRGGVAIWHSANLSNPGASWSSPALTREGTPTPRPTWQAEEKPARVVTDPAKIRVYAAREVKRFHVATRRSDGLSLSLTAGATRRLCKEVEKAGPHAYYVFDYGAYENAVVMVPNEETSLADWAVAHEKKP